MCGIVGQLNPPGGVPVTEETLHRMCAAIVHRGPDDEGLFVDGTFGMGMRRLSINDLAGGHQPLGNEDESIVVVCNGEIYNSPELRQALAARGHRFASHSDVAVIPHLYEEYGDDFVRHLDGMFALALWDTRRRRLVLARDRLGIKPLYLAERNGALAFASEVSALVVAGWCEELDVTSLHHYLALGYIPAPGSIFAHVRKVEPGCQLTVDERGAVSERRYWELRFAPAPRTQSDDAYAEEVLAALRGAVKSHLLSDVPVGVFLSGGVDSSGLVGLMSEVSSQRIHTFSVGFEEKSFDELDLARKVAQRYGTEHHEVVVRPDAVGILPKLVRHFGEPFADSSAIPVYYVSELAHQTVKVVLSGEGGDEVFAGYETYLAAKLSALYRRLPSLVGRSLVPAMVQRIPVSHAKVSFDYKAKRFVAGAYLSPADGHFWWKVVLSEAAQAELCLGPARTSALETAALFRAAADRAGSDDWLARLQAIDAHVYLPDDILTKADRMSMAHALEARVPYLDRALVELAARLPSDVKLRRFAKKYVLKRALKDHVPREILRARKRGFNVPVPSWLRGELREVVADVLSPAALQRVGLFEPRMVQRLINEHNAMQVDHSRPLWSLLVFMTWYDTWRQLRVGAGTPFDATTPSTMPLSATNGLASHDP
jgi:asparagine synthase (glutamine-hydrolysing)